MQTSQVSVATNFADGLSQVDSPLRCHDLYKSYGSAMVLNGLDFSIQSGAVMGLIGRNGAGKSTLIRILLGLVMPGRGDAFVFGERAPHMTDASKSRLAYVPQQPDALSWMRIGDMLDFIGSFYPRWDEQYARETLLRWGLSTDKQLVKLSPGERQRVALIRALAANPELLVLDEPASALDPVARRELLREIALRAGESGTTVLFSSHIVSDLERVASHVAFLHQGKLIFNAPMDDLKETHVRLYAPAEVMKNVYGKLPGELSRRSHKDGHASIVLQRLLHEAWPTIARQPGVRMDVLGLEDLFVEITE
ncbi:MAG: ABC transporter ATP-binding protein [Steroidobacteraceae bacterium]